MQRHSTFPCAPSPSRSARSPSTSLPRRPRWPRPGHGARDRGVPARDVLEVVPRLAEIWDEPFSDSSQFPTHLVAAVARRSVTVRCRVTAATSSSPVTTATSGWIASGAGRRRCHRAFAAPRRRRMPRPARGGGRRGRVPAGTLAGPAARDEGVQGGSGAPGLDSPGGLPVTDRTLGASRRAGTRGTCSTWRGHAG